MHHSDARIYGVYWLYPSRWTSLRVSLLFVVAGALASNIGQLDSHAMYPTSNGAGASNGYTSSSRHPASARSSSGYRNDRSRSPVRGNDLNQSSSNSTSAAQSQTKRNSKACENCRTRRVKCQGGQPCLACVEVGLSERCAVRAKARPNR